MLLQQKKNKRTQTILIDEERKRNKKLKQE